MKHIKKITLQKEQEKEREIILLAIHQLPILLITPPPLPSK